MFMFDWACRSSDGMEKYPNNDIGQVPLAGPTVLDTHRS